jgi:FKBP-type peptidyl-prolyl cis-trans isomerase (trigger factor)
MIKELEAELAKCAWHRHIEELEEDAQKFHGDMEKYKANNARLRECLKRLIDAHNNDADMDIYDQLIIEAAAEIAREGLKEKANPCP